MFFAPSTQPKISPEVLGLLGKLATTICLFEPFRNPVTIDEIRRDVPWNVPTLEVNTDFIRRANRENTRLNEEFTPLLLELSREELLARFNSEN
ncbi:MAG: hypothetical protein F6K40_34775 [Okeania sp. SIO3I5]|uniref:hypothetical protein n=1 Tax=Okeania sp. SIO3I5 TaxID=2607805 RepID=UPI0013B67EB4|nr:hypothetical protein [Okeania sp. SIO3I5]NEQ41100.1 hypothetical protein [Okeania sp. SIO3I5]